MWCIITLYKWAITIWNCYSGLWMANVQLEFMYGLFIYKNGFETNFHLMYLVRNNNNPQRHYSFSIVELLIFFTGTTDDRHNIGQIHWVKCHSKIPLSEEVRIFIEELPKPALPLQIMNFCIYNNTLKTVLLL